LIAFVFFDFHNFGFCCFHGLGNFLSVQLWDTLFSSSYYSLPCKTNLRGLSLRENYTDRAAAACRRS
jgi:hypothetical protein